MRERLAGLAERVRLEIVTTGTVTVEGVPAPVNPQARTPWSGLCRPALEKLRELAPELPMRGISFRFSGDDFWSGGIHVIAEVETPEGTYHLDPTIHQYVPDAPLVYGPQERYPIKIVQGSVRYF